MSCCKKPDVHKTHSAGHTSVGTEIPVAKLKCQHNCESCKEKREKNQSRLVKKAGLTLTMMTPLLVNAQDATVTQSSFWTDPVHDPRAPLYLLFAALGVVVVLAVAVMIVTIRVLASFRTTIRMEEARLRNVVYTPARAWWTDAWERINGLQPLEHEKDIELDHDYDGIKELDNHLPPWWKGVFYVTIAFGIGYLFVFHILYVFPLPAEEYQNELTVVAEQQRILKASAPQEVIDENALTFSKDDELINRGKVVFTSNNCGSCHRNDGGGNIGPNLTDEYWVHGGSARRIFVTIRDGFVEKGMPAWGKVMHAKDVKALTFYVMSLKGSNPANAKKPQGELFIAPAEVVKSDTSRIQASLK